ncbi:MAG: hypothetical protein ABJI04_06095, partial [Marinomonas sp.]
LIAWHSRTGASEALAQAAAQGAGRAAVLLRAEDVVPADFLKASAYIFVCPENLAAMSGVMKEMFDRCYYPVLGQIEGRAYATIIAAGTDGEGAQRQIDRIATGWRLRRVADPMIVNCSAQTPEEILQMKTVAESELEKAKELGASFLQAIEMGIY